MIELYQAEWCPYSSYVRQRLTERGADLIARQVLLPKSARTVMKEATGADSIPALVAGDQVIAEFEDILQFVDKHHPPKDDSDQHAALGRNQREKAAIWQRFQQYG